MSDSIGHTEVMLTGTFDPNSLFREHIAQQQVVRWKKGDKFKGVGPIALCNGAAIKWLFFDAASLKIAFDDALRFMECSMSSWDDFSPGIQERRLSVVYHGEEVFPGLFVDKKDIFSLARMDFDFDLDFS